MLEMIQPYVVWLLLGLLFILMLRVRSASDYLGPVEQNEQPKGSRDGVEGDRTTRVEEKSDRGIEAWRGE